MATEGISLKLKTEGAREIEQRLAHLYAGLKQPVQLMNILGAVLENSTRARFRSGKDPEGVAWKPSIRAKETGGKTLVDHGHLRDSITHDASDRQAIVGTNLVYAAIQQLGGVIRAKAGGMLTFNIPGVGWRQVASVTIPARPYLGVSDDDRIEISTQIERYIERVAA